MAIFVDYSALAISGVMAFQRDLKHGGDEKIVDLIRHVILTSLLNNKKKFSPRFGEMVICTDGRNYWRKEHFKFYKASRAKTRAASDLNWKLIFDTISSIKDDLKESFPYKVIHIDTAEADDIIGVLTKHLQTNELITTGLEEEPQKVLILSSDKDNLQLQKYSNVSQWSPMQKKLVKPDTNAKNSLIDKLCTGDAGDGIPNIMSADDVFVTEGTRQTPFRKSRLNEFYTHGIDACKTDLERRNFQRNQLLVDYEMIPADLREKIITTYKETTPSGSKKKIMEYLIRTRCRNLLDSIEDF